MGESKMPQIDISTFPMQIFWALVVFALFYLIMAGIILPRFGRKLANRNTKINEDLLAAKRFEHDAEADRAFCEEHLVETRVLSRERLRVAQENAVEFMNRRMAELHSELHKKAEEAAANLRKAEDIALAELPKEIVALVSQVVKNFTGESPNHAEISEQVVALLAQSVKSVPTPKKSTPRS
ncbi:MAG: hypothetical protein ORN98_06325 [Alphaproteobacteria bacterium]|nr:hypothetical protein [Alphaproteobacteria bacterium]